MNIIAGKKVQVQNREAAIYRALIFKNIVVIKKIFKLF